jgi:CheY-like chemotaxis protein/signal transduction histidine kinase
MNDDNKESFQNILFKNVFALAVFTKKEIVFRNELFCDVLGISEDEKDFDINEYIKDKSFCDRIFSTQFLIKESIEIVTKNKQNKNVLFYSHKTEKDEVLCFLIDITMFIEKEVRARSKCSMFISLNDKLKEPVKNIINMSELMNSTSLSNEQKKYNEIILENSNVLLEIMEAILNYSKLESSTIELRNEEFVYQDFINEFQRIFSDKVEKKNLLLSFYIDKNVPEIIVCDKGKLKKIIHNLINNSILLADSGLVNVSSIFHDDTNMLEISIEDSNVSVSRDDMKKIFTPFYNLVGDKYKEKEWDTIGLELIISKNLIELMGGKMHQEKSMANGSKFVFNVKVVDKKFEREYAGKNRILVVDDDQINVLSFKVILRNLKYDSDIALDGLEAIDILKKKEYDIVLMDMHMPKMNGVETIKAIRGMNIKQPKIIVFTGYKLDEIEGINEIQYDGYIGKPIDPKKIEKILESLSI